MNVLVLNSGSSSIKFSIYDTSSKEPRCLVDGELSGIGTSKAVLTAGAAQGRPGSPDKTVDAQDVESGIAAVFETVKQPGMPPVDAVGYRVVHPGAKLQHHQRITRDVLRELEKAAEFAPLHDPDALKVIHAGMEQFPDLAHYACFDTVFHQTMPEEATTYALPLKYRDQGVRRYGFHGLSCESILRQLKMHPAGVPKRMVIAHLGSGCSVTAVVDGLSIDTTMGLTPTGGVVMGTRPGDLDPGLVLYLLREQKAGAPEAIASVENMLNHQSGLVGLSGLKNDVRAMRVAAGQGSTGAALALKVFTRSVTKAVGGFCWLMGGVDAIVFSGGIGEHDEATRQAIAGDLSELGVALKSSSVSAKGIQTLSLEDSRTKVLVVPSQEDLMIAVHVERMAEVDAAL